MFGLMQESLLTKSRNVRTSKIDASKTNSKSK